MNNGKKRWKTGIRQTLIGLLFTAPLFAPAQAEEIFYIHSDHLNTPRLMTNSNGQTIWQNLPLTEPFGASAPEEDPDGDGVPFVFNLRFPGQYYDQETNAHYNYYRDHYFPSLGRYGQSDPIGLLGGINTYAYVSGGPLTLVDVLGLLGFSKAECERILREIEREYQTIKIIEQQISNIGDGGEINGHELKVDATPYGYRGEIYKNSSGTYQNAVDDLESNVGFTVFGRVGNFVVGGVGIYTLGLHGYLHNTTAKQHQKQVMLGTEIYRIYYVISKMKATYEENCIGCESQK